MISEDRPLGVRDIGIGYPGTCAAGRPAPYVDGHGKACRMACGLPYLHAQYGGVAAETHGSDSEAVSLFEETCFEVVQLGDRIMVIERAKELFLCTGIGACAFASDADADDSRRTTIALRLPDGVQNAFAHALEVSTGGERMIG